MDFKPNFVLMSPGMKHLRLQCTAQATKLAQAHRAKPAATTCKSASVVKEEAVARIVKGGGDPECWQLVLSEMTLQFGQYRGQTFKWLLENDVGYCAMVVASHQKERDNGDTSQSPLATNKDSLALYAHVFPEMAAVVRHRLMVMGAPLVRELDEQPLRMGHFPDETYRSLYESADERHRAYVCRIRAGKPGLAGSFFHTLNSYIVGRDNEANYKSPHPVQSERVSVKSERVSARPEPSDDDVLAAVIEVESQQPSSSQASTSSAVTSPVPATRPPPLVWARGDTVPQLPAPKQSVLPKGWLNTLPESEHAWVGRALFERTAGGRAVLTTNLKLWWEPPSPPAYLTQPPASNRQFFHSSFFLWAPYKMWGVKLACPDSKCGHDRLTGGGLYRTVRRVLDLRGWYFMGTESLECLKCNKKISAWDKSIRKQLHISKQLLFPAIMTYQLACDKAVISLMRARSLGNSATQLRRVLTEIHSEEWMARCTSYLSILTQLGVPVSGRDEIPPMRSLPLVPWFLAAYVRDVLPRLEDNKGRLTSIFGNILKMDSTKKLTKKLAGESAGTAAWVTNVGNEYGQVLMSVLTAAEGEGLSAMADGLVRRYGDAGKPPPEVLYVDRDCCSVAGKSKIHDTFGQWDRLVVRLDVWHLMRRIARGVSTDAHLLYGPFMARLASAMFEWDERDLERLRAAKQAAQGGGHITLKPKELERHCRRRTRGAEETERLVQEVLDHFWDAKDTMGNPLIYRERMTEIWRTQRRHMRCIQDPPGVALYTKTGEVKKGGVTLPVFRCARGSSSLESFHLHQCRFIPGTSANALHFQVYLLEGLTQWNEDRGRAAVVGGGSEEVRCYNARVVDAFQEVVRMRRISSPLRNYTPPGKYTGELIGVEYLLAQTGAVLQSCPGGEGEHGDDWQDQVTDGQAHKEEEEEEDEGLELHRLLAMSALTEGLQGDEPGQERGAQEEEKEEEDVVGPDGRGGYQHVCRLADALVQLRVNAFVKPSQVSRIKDLWEKLPDHDKGPPQAPPPRRKPMVQGRFKNSKGRHVPSMEAAKRLFIGKGNEVARSPGASRLVEAIFSDLSNIHTQGHSLAGVRISRWGLVMRDYSRIRDLCRTRELLAAAPVHLFAVNHRTLTQWHSQRSKHDSAQAMCVAIPAPSSKAATADALAEARPLMNQQPLGEAAFEHPVDSSGTAVTHRGPVLPDLFMALPAPQGERSTPLPAASTPLPAASTPLPSASASPGASTSAPAPTPPSGKRGLIGCEVAHRVRAPKVAHFRCKRCGNPKTKEYGHSRYRSEHFCAMAEGRTVDEWLEEKRSQDTDRKVISLYVLPSPRPFSAGLRCRRRAGVKLSTCSFFLRAALDSFLAARATFTLVASLLSLLTLALFWHPTDWYLT
ncbi:uncharacterized protein LOC127596645 [Hippocampus zosterae]|uniref:uncharacterized protein LOC127596645 n=1 Tax=Hippocampus zosterae TaxID=109293 RepID=UPI00223D2D47|nr:uncharacterized protein LOC127596645 [Hippocampus zosterae]